MRNLAVGSRLGRFELVRRLGEGTSGTVFLADDTLLEEQVALKVLNPGTQEVGLKRFKREIVLARKVSHRGVCRVFDLHQEQGVIFQTMEYIRGVTLESVLEKDGALEINRALRIVHDVAEAIGAAHACGIMHRDLKPANIILGLGRKPTVVDFGCATAPMLAPVTQVGFVVGTVRYLAPELLHGRAEASPASEVYALGVVLYRCLVGHPPSRGDTLEAVKAESQRGPAPPSKFNHDISREVDGIVLRALDPEPHRRFKSVTEFSTALGAVAEETHPRIEIGRQTPDAPWDGDIEGTVTNVVNLLEDARVFESKVGFTTILFTDIVGITQFFSSYGDIAGCQRIQKHNDLLFDEVKQWGGTVIKTIGDAIMASFSSPHDGVSAAIGMQRALDAHNLGAPIAEEPILIRIGVNTGKAIIEHSDVFGDTVNVAARVSSRASAEEILVTDAVRRAVEYSTLPIVHHATVRLKGKGDERFRLFRVEWKRPGDGDITDELLAKSQEIELQTAKEIRVEPAAQPASAPQEFGRPPADTAVVSAADTAETDSAEDAERKTEPIRVDHGTSGVRVQQWGLSMPRVGVGAPGRAGGMLPPTPDEEASSGLDRTSLGRPRRRTSQPLGNSFGGKSFSQRVREKLSEQGKNESPEVAPGTAAPVKSGLGGAAGSDSVGASEARLSPSGASNPGAAGAEQVSAGAVDVRQQCEVLLGEIETILVRKGIIRGDAEGLDKVMDTAARNLKQGGEIPALRFLHLARGRAQDTAIDGAFIAAKISRLRRALERSGEIESGGVAPGGPQVSEADPRTSSSYDVVLREVASLSSHGQLEAANLQLNACFAKLGPKTHR